MNISDKEYLELVTYIKANIGIDLDSSKKMMVVSRLRSAFLKENVTTYEQIKKLVIVDKDSKATSILINAITTNYTYFMREPDHFRYFQQTVLPEIKKNSRTKDLRVWCAACSSGEEAYTLSLVIDDVLGSDKHMWDRKLLATDISTEMLTTCVNGVYSASAIKTLPTNWVSKYFKQINPLQYSVSAELRNQILFRPFNLMTENFPFKKKFNVIFCRNVMIYFDTTTRNALIQKFYNSLEHGGYLFIGHSECIEKGVTNFKYVMPSVYRKE